MNLNDYAKRSHQNAADHGFWPREGRNFGEMVALVHSELSEALEEHRNNEMPVYFKCEECGATNPTPKERHYVPKTGFIGWLLTSMGITKMVFCRGVIDKPEGTAVELCDAIIRLVDILDNSLEYTSYDVEAVMDLKMDFNETRPFKHGKEY